MVMHVLCVCFEVAPMGMVDVEVTAVSELLLVLSIALVVSFSVFLIPSPLV